MGEGPLSKYLVGIIIFTLFIVGGVSMLALLAEEDPTFTDSDTFERFNESFDQMNEVTETVGGIRTSIEDASTDFGVFGVLNALISSAWQTLKLMFQSLGFMSDAYDGMSDIFGLPAWIPGLIILIIVIIISFAIYSAIFQSKL